MSYDYVIVGAGSSGAALAGRLAEDPSTTVLLLEAGLDYRSADAPPEMRSPNPWILLNLKQFHVYSYSALRARYTALQERSVYRRGRGLGGSSAVNSQVAMRGVPEDFDLWAAQGCTGWSWQEVLPAFIRLEDDLDFGDAPYHGRRGPIPIYRAPREQWGSVDCALYEAALDLGYGWADDHNAPWSAGVSPCAMNSRGGVRVSTNDGYLESARGRGNLTIIGDAMVDRVLLDGSRATGVRVRIANDWMHVIGREIVLCAGAIHSPAILLRSGIGPAEELQALEIPVSRDTPAVGQHLVEHPNAGLGLRLRPASRATTIHTRLINCCVRYSSGLADAGRNDMIFLAANLEGDSEADLAMGSIVVSVYQTYSQGWLRLTTPDPESDPEIELNMLSDERDLVRMRDGMRRLFAICRHPAITTIADAVYLDDTGISSDHISSDQQIDDWLLAQCGPVGHVVGTCRMGPITDSHSVVDPDCRVIGIEGLRVVDASIMPAVPRANTHLTCVMLAEHMAARLRMAGRSV